jgi:hypothetical protein
LSHDEDAKGKLLPENILQLPKALSHPVLNITLPGLSHVIPVLETRQALLLRYLHLRQINRVRANGRRTTRPLSIIRLPLRRSIRTAFRVPRISTLPNLLIVRIPITIGIYGSSGTPSLRAGVRIVWIST